MSRRKRNPMTGGTLLLGTAAVVAGYFILRGKKKKRRRTETIPPPRPSDVLPSEPLPPPPPTGNYVGSSGYSWPHKSKFPAKGSFEGWLAANGYANNQNSNPLDESTRNAVFAFQGDFNAVRQYALAHPELGLISLKELDEDGLIGKNTIGAMVDVDGRIKPAFNAGWPQIMLLLQEVPPAPTPTPTPPESPWGNKYNGCSALITADEDHNVDPHLTITADAREQLKLYIKARQGGPLTLDLEWGFGVPGVPHYHSVTLTTDQLMRLSRGEAVTVASTEVGPAPYQGHVHTIQLGCI